MTLVRGEVPTGMSLLVVDATRDEKGFEHKMSERIYATLQAAHVPLAAPLRKPMLFGEVIKELNTTYTALLLVAHGRGNRKDDAALIKVADFVTSWYLLKETGIDLSDKFISLCVCEGYCDDMVDSVVKSHVYANTVVGSREKLYASEAEAFFPAFYKSLLGLTEGVMIPDIFKEKVAEYNHLAANKMVAFSLGFTAP